LTNDAKTLLSDKEKLMQIKDQLFKLAADTKGQVDMIEQLVATVDGHLKSAEGNITNTSNHVHQIDQIRRELTGE
jgi:uncharacterized protein YbcI